MRDITLAAFVVGVVPFLCGPAGIFSRGKAMIFHLLFCGGFLDMEGFQFFIYGSALFRVLILLVQIYKVFPSG